MSLSVFKTGLPSLGHTEGSAGPRDQPPGRGRGSVELPWAFQAVGAQHCRGGRTGGLQPPATCVPARHGFFGLTFCTSLLSFEGRRGLSVRLPPSCVWRGIGCELVSGCVEQIPPQLQRWVLTDRSQSGSSELPGTHQASSDPSPPATETSSGMVRLAQGQDSCSVVREGEWEAPCGHQRTGLG